MKAITIWQPWASLWACGAKQFETRGWATSYRGSIAIHAAANPTISVLRTLEQGAIDAMGVALSSSDDGRYGAHDLLDLPTGCIIATAKLVGCHRIVLHGGRGIHSDDPGWLETDRGIYEPTDQELLFGDWTPGRYAWEIRDVQTLPEPVPAKGKQGLWNWETCL